MAEETVQATDQPELDASDSSGAEPDVLDTLSEMNPEPTEGDEGQTGEEAEGEAETAEEGDESSEGEATDQPTVEEWLEGLTPNERAQYAKRYPKAWGRLTDPESSEDDRQLLIDKINTDVEFRHLRDQHSETAEEEPTPDAEEAEQEPVVATDPAKVKEQYQAYISDVVKNYVDPEAVRGLGMAVLSNLGVDVASKDPEVQALLQKAPELGKTLATGAVDLINTVVPNMLQGMIGQAFPLFQKMYERSLHGTVWDGVRESTKEYAELPPYGSKEFKEQARKAASAIPEFDLMVFTDKKGNRLPPEQQAEKKYAILARSMAGKKADPVAMAQAVKTGKDIARKKDNQRAAGRAMGSGRSNQQFSNESKDSVMDDLKSAIDQSAAFNPFGSK